MSIRGFYEKRGETNRVHLGGGDCGGHGWGMQNVEEPVLTNLECTFHCYNCNYGISRSQNLAAVKPGEMELSCGKSQDDQYNQSVRHNSCPSVYSAQILMAEL